MMESDRDLPPVKDVFMKLREGMGHKWPVGTFNPEDPTVIEVEYKVVGGEPGDPSNSIDLVTQKPNNQLPEVING